MTRGVAGGGDFGTTVKLQCPDYTFLIAQGTLEPAQERAAKDVFKDVSADSYSLVLVQRGAPMPPTDFRAAILKTLAIAVADEKSCNRGNAVLGLLERRDTPEAKTYLEELSRDYPLQPIREKAAQILAVPEPEQKVCVAIGFGLMNYYSLYRYCSHPVPDWMEDGYWIP